MSEIHAGVYPRAQDIENAKAAPFGVSAASATDADAALIAGDFGKQHATAADINGDGLVNVLDLVLVSSNFGKGGIQP